MTIDDAAVGLGITAGIAMMFGWVWAVALAVRPDQTGRRWGLWGYPWLFFFSWRHGSTVHRGLFIAYLVMGTAAVAIAGDIFENRHPKIEDRGWTEIFFGCGGQASYDGEAEVAVTGTSMLLQGFGGRQVDDMADGLVAAKIAALAYETEDFVNRIANDDLRVKVLRVGTVFSSKPKWGQFAVILATDTHIFIAIRGTNDPEDWLKNLDVRFENTEWGNVHRGFYKALDALWDQIESQLEKLRNADQRIWTVGHSLGGAMAVLTAGRLRYESDLRVDGIFTFGQPAVGNDEYNRHLRSEFRDRYIRYTNTVDAVPGAPTGRSHVGLLRSFDTEGHMYEGPVTWPQQLRDILCASKYEAGAEFKQHAIQNYINRLSEIL